MKGLSVILPFVVLLSVASCGGRLSSSEFANPGDEYGIDVWWLWHNSYVSKTSMTKELSSMKDRHFHGFTIYDTGGHNQRGNEDLPVGPCFGSAEWIGNARHALNVADSLGLAASLVIQSGWNLGGPDVAPEDMSKHVVASMTKICGGQDVRVNLPAPENKFGWFKDIAVLAFPLVDQSADCISKLSYRTCDKELGMSTPDARYLLFKDDDCEKNKAWVAKVPDIVDVSQYVSESDTLCWDAPMGDWMILRIGYAPTGAKVSTSSDNWGGYAIDHLNSRALDNYWATSVAPVLDSLSDFIPATLQTIETDSWEAGGTNWTDDFREKFYQNCGYDIVKYLPCAFGYVVENENTTLSFLADWRKTIGILMAEEHYAHLADLAHQYGLQTMPEAAGPHAGPFDGIRNYGHSDILMSEFWAQSPHRPLDVNRFFVKQASSAAHIYGKDIVNAEAFTTIGKNWNDLFWHDHKPAFDREICAGMNRICIHSFASSPEEMGIPGAQSFAGSYFDSRNTWWDWSSPVFDYFRRVQYVVRQGKFCADVLYYYGDHVPNVYPLKSADMAGAMPGYDYDVTDETVLLTLSVKKGLIYTPSGMEYRVLVLPDHRTLSMQALLKIEELVQAGATVIGARPLHLVSLVGGQEAQAMFESISKEIWGESESLEGEHIYGKGKVVWGVSARAYLLAAGVAPDFSIVEDPAQEEFDYIHYKVGDADVYFISNQKDTPVEATCSFRLNGKRPEIWDALTGGIKYADTYYDDASRLCVPLHFDPCGSLFVVFDRRCSWKTKPYGGVRDIKTRRTITSPWELSFSEEYDGVLEVIQIDTLKDICTFADPRIKYYSGPISYHTVFEYQISAKEQYLTLGDVLDVGITDVVLNGIELGTTWTKPFRYDVTGIVRNGENVLDVCVVNSWYNRVAGEEMNEDLQKITNTNINLSHDFRGRPLDTTPLSASGLMGPVEIIEF